MNILSLFVVIPVLMLLGLWVARNLNQVRGVMVAGSSCLLALSIWLTMEFIDQRAAGNTAEMLFQYSVPWVKPLNIAYAIGVDGISVVMLCRSRLLVAAQAAYQGVFPLVYIVEHRCIWLLYLH